MPADPSRRRSYVSAAAALVVHALVAAVATRASVAPRPVASTTRAERSVEADAELEIEVAPAATAAPATSAAIAAAPSPGAAHDGARVASLDRAPSGGGALEGVAAGSLGAGSGAPAPGDRGASPAGSAAVAGPASTVTLFPASPPGPDGWVSRANPFLPRTAAEFERSDADRKRDVDVALKAPLRGRDADLGLGPEGPLLRALEDATHASASDERGWATFVAVVNGSGVVVDLKLVGSSGASGWEDARRRAARALEGKSLALRGAKGAELTIRVDSDIRLPSGSRPGKPITPTAEHSDVQLPSGAPSPGGADNVKTYTVGRFDLTDLASKPRRVVHARVVDAKVL